VLSRASPKAARLALGLVLVTALAGLHRAEVGSSPDEALYASIGREMLHTGDFLTPRLDGAPAWYKPPLLFWATAGSARLLGESPFAERLPVALCVVALAWLVGALAAELHGPGQRVRAMLFLCTTFGAMRFGRLVMTDVPLMVVVAAAHWVAWRARAGSTTWPWLLGALGGLSWLLKSPAFTLVVLGSPLLFLRLAARHTLSRRGLAIAGGTCLLVGAPWYVSSLVTSGSAFWRFYGVGENVGRLSGSWTPLVPARLLLALGVFSLPWLPFALPPRARRAPLAPETLLGLTWLGAVFVLFLPLTMGHAQYLLPALPAVVLFASRPEPWRGARVVTAVLLGLAAVALGAALRWDFGVTARTATLLAALLLAGAAVLAATLRVELAAACVALGSALVAGVALPAALPRLEVPQPWRGQKRFSYRLFLAPSEDVQVLWREEEVATRLAAGRLVLVAEEDRAKLGLGGARVVFSLPRLAHALPVSTVGRAFWQGDTGPLFSQVQGLCRPEGCGP
jgi:4-amino-4-deoxy-L-arabinose transferase-like glycosyltransferase